jgi:signal transduction histidine kinase
MKKQSSQEQSPEEVIRQSEERYKAFIANSSEGIWRYELDKPLSRKWTVKRQIDHIYNHAYLAECNDAMAKMYGYKKAKDIIGVRLSDLMKPTEQANNDYLKAFITSNYKLSNVETHEQDRFGNRRIFENTLIGIGKGDNIYRAWGTQKDVTEQRFTEERKAFLEKVSSKLVVSLDHEITLQQIAQLIVPYLADYCRIAIIDKDFHIKEIMVNHKDPTKVSLAEALYDSYKDLPNATHGIPSLLKKGKSELITKIDDSKLKKFSSNKKVIAIVKQLGLKSYIGVPLTARGNVIGAMTLSSVQPNRFYTKSDVAYIEEIARRVALTLDNIRLFKEAQDAIALRDDFISVASHELKTPVTSVKIYTQVLKKQSEKIHDAVSVRSLERMDRQLDKLTELIYNLLDIAKIQKGRLEYSMKTFAFDAMIKESVEMLQNLSPTHEIILKGKTTKKIHGDEDRLGQVISNLIANAIKYSPNANKVYITLSSSTKEIKVTVQDLGIGVQKEFLEKIFDRFYRVDANKGKTFPGLGLGLYISKEIIERHGGKLWAESESGNGAKFHFTLPVTKS